MNNVNILLQMSQFNIVLHSEPGEDKSMKIILNSKKTIEKKNTNRTEWTFYG